ncbi:MAG: hypothetical protein JWM78_2018 [Verrucomicrobiaceae bacterium]|nr:hypothetical protein [Verrucomicrobiaceae bacterium]
MTSDDKFATAAHLYVLLRRKCGRVIDTVWMAQNTDYALEVLRVTREQADADLSRLADRFEALMFGEGSVKEPIPVAVEQGTPVFKKYVGSLR